MYCILSHSSNSECAIDLQVLKMSISILETLPQNGLCCTMLMRAGLSSLMFVSGPVLTLALDKAEKSLMHLRAAISAGLCGGGDS
jgi:hypothetical protein